MKNFIVTARVNMRAEHEERVAVRANTERKAKIFAKEKLEARGFRNIDILGCEEAKQGVFSNNGTAQV